MTLTGAVHGLKVFRRRSVKLPVRRKLSGLFGAVLALMVQVTVPFAPMPATSNVSAAQQIAASWG